MRRWKGSVPALAVGLVAVATPAIAASSGVALHWEPAPETVGCPTEAEIIASISTLLRSVPPRDEPVEVWARVEGRAPALRLEIRARRGDEEGRRLLEGESCATLAEALALIVAMLVDPDLPGFPEGMANPYGGEEAGAPPARAPGSDREASGTGGSEGSRAAREGAPSRWAGGVEAGLSVGLLPGPSATVGVAGELCLRWFCPFLGAIGAFPSGASVANTADARMDLWLGAARSGARLRAGTGRAQGGVALALEVGAMGAASHGVDSPGRGRTLFVAAAPGAFGTRTWGPVRLGLEVTLVVPFFRPAFTIEGLGTVFRTAPASGRFAFTLEYVFR